MKTYKLALVALAALSLAACNKEQGVDNTPQGVVKGDTFTKLGITLSAPATKAPTDEQEDWQGRTTEYGVHQLHYYSNATGENKSFVYGGAALPTSTTANGTGLYHVDNVTPHMVFQTDAWKTSAGQRTMGIALNKVPSGITPDVNNANNQTYGSHNNEIAQIALLSNGYVAGDNTTGFTMTSSVDFKTISKDIEQADVDGGSTEAENVFTMEVERVVAQGIVATGFTGDRDTKDSKFTVKDGTLKFSVENGAVKTYFWGNNAGDRTITASTGLYADYKSAIDDKLLDFAAAQDPTQAEVQNNIIRLGNLRPAAAIDRTKYVDDVTGANIGNTSGTATTISKPENVAAYMNALAGVDLGGYNAKNVGAYATDNKTTAGNVPGIYFLENSVTKDAATWTAENKDHGFYRLAYAKVYGNVTPKELYKVVWEMSAPYDVYYSWQAADVTAFESKYNTTPLAFVAGNYEGANILFKYSTDETSLDPSNSANWADEAHVIAVAAHGWDIAAAVAAGDVPANTVKFIVKEHVDAARVKPLSVVSSTTDASILTEYNTRTDKSFYYGVTTGHYYLTANDAYYDPAVYRQDGSGNWVTQAVWKFQDGKCAWRALWNRQSETKGATDYDTWVLSGDTRRNNTYLLTITDFLQVGMPWDSSDPGDPNLPKIDPEDPDGPNPPTPPTPPIPDNPDIEDEEAYMAVRAVVLPWNLVTRDVVIR